MIAVSAFSAIRFGSKKLEYHPLRSFGIRNSTVPAQVSQLR